MKVLRAILTLMTIATAAACGGSDSTPTTPTTPTPPPLTQVQLAVFSDPESNFTTSDVRDVQGQIVRFDITSSSLIWAADGRSSTCRSSTKICRSTATSMK